MCILHTIKKCKCIESATSHHTSEGSRLKKTILGQAFDFNVRLGSQAVADPSEKVDKL